MNYLKKVSSNIGICVFQLLLIMWRSSILTGSRFVFQTLNCNGLAKRPTRIRFGSRQSVTFQILQLTAVVNFCHPQINQTADTISDYSNFWELPRTWCEIDCTRKIDAADRLKLNRLLLGNIRKTAKNINRIYLWINMVGTMYVYKVGCRYGSCCFKMLCHQPQQLG